jgi:hypothetical protein
MLPFKEVSRLSQNFIPSIKNMNTKTATTEMYPRISWELVEDSLGSVEHTLGTTALKKREGTGI